MIDTKTGATLTKNLQNSEGMDFGYKYDLYFNDVIINSRTGNKVIFIITEKPPVTYAGVLEMLNKCTVVNVGVPSIKNGDNICSDSGEKCIYNFIGFDPKVTVSGDSNTISQPIPCEDNFDNYPTASWAKTICCSTP